MFKGFRKDTATAPPPQSVTDVGGNSNRNGVLKLSYIGCFECLHNACYLPGLLLRWGLKDTVVPWRLKAASAKGHTYLNNNRDLLALAIMWDKNLP